MVEHVKKDLSGFTRICKLTDIPIGEARTYDTGEGSVALCNVDGVLYAINNLCTHDDGPLGAGSLAGFEIECPRHGARFDVRTGAATAMPAAVGVDIFETAVYEEDVYVKLDV
ncbi:MAG: Rieske (2Fe-2S) protein [Candidatus Zixiibacteriota bacterium]